MKKWLMRLAIAVFCIGTMSTYIALAQTPQNVPTQAPQTQITTTAPVTSDTTISIGTIGGQVLTWIAVAFSVPIGAVITGWIYKAMQLAGVKGAEALRDKLQTIVVNGLNDGAARAAERFKGQAPIQIKNAAVIDAIKYAQEHGAETITALGLDPKSGEAVNVIKARIETAIVDPTIPTNPVLLQATIEPVVNRPLPPRSDTRPDPFKIDR